jgi:hypothetical protein
MDLAQLLGSGIDPAMLATLGNPGGKSQFTDMLMKSLNPNPAGDFRKAVGQPDLSNLDQLIGSAPMPERVNTAPNLPAPQHLQAIGFGMAQNAQTPGSSVGSSFGAGGNNALKLGGENAERAIREAESANRAEIASWQGQADLAKKKLDTQMKGPELDMKMMDLTGNSLTTDANRASTDAYRQGQLLAAADRTAVAERNAKTREGQLGVAQTKAETQLELGLKKLGLNEMQIANEAAKIENQASQAADAAAARAAAQGRDLSTRERIAVQRDFTSWVNRAVANKGKPLDDAELASLRKQFDSQQAGSQPQAAAPQAAPSAPQVPDAEKARILAEANAAIAAGRNREGVIAKLKSLGIEVAQ